MHDLPLLISVPIPSLGFFLIITKRNTSYDILPFPQMKMTFHHLYLHHFPFNVVIYDEAIKCLKRFLLNFIASFSVLFLKCEWKEHIKCCINLICFKILSKEFLGIIFFFFVQVYDLENAKFFFSNLNFCNLTFQKFNVFLICFFLIFKFIFLKI